MKNGWMVRAGRGGRLYQNFLQDKFVAVGWNLLAPLDQFQDKAAIKKAYVITYGDDKPGKTANSISMIHRFVKIQKDDYIVTYDPKSRNYLVGRDLGQYQVVDINDYCNIRKVDWIGMVSRDNLSESSQRSLMSVLTLFALKPEIVEEFETQLKSFTLNTLVQA